MKTCSTASATDDRSQKPTGRKHRRPPNCHLTLRDLKGVTGLGTIRPDPYALDLDPVSTSRVAVMSRARGMWLQYDAMFGFHTLVGDWDVQETLAKGVAACPDGTLLAMIAAAYPDGLGHSYEVEHEHHLLTRMELVDTGYDWRAPKAISVLKKHLSALDSLDLTDPVVAFAATWVALAEISRWSFGLVRRGEPRLPVLAVASVLEAVREADKHLAIGDDEPVVVTPTLGIVAGPMAGRLV